MAISKFKATCLAALERVRRTRTPIQVTRLGTPVAEVVPPSPPPRPKGWIGCMKSSGRVAGDLVRPVVNEAQWEALRR